MAFFMSGGLPMIFVLLFGLMALAAGVRFAVRPNPPCQATIQALSWATFFSVAVGICTDLAAVGAKVPLHPEWVQEEGMANVVLKGISESMSPGILGFTLLSLTWLAVAIGCARLARASRD